MKKTVLLVDGDEDSRVVYHTMLVHAGYEVELAVDGEAGFELAHSWKPDVLVTALAITKLSGLELIRRVRAEASLDSTRIMVLTASGLEADREEAMRTGCDLFFNKPVEPKRLLESIKQLIGPAARLAQ